METDSLYAESSDAEREGLKWVANVLVWFSFTEAFESHADVGVGQGWTQCSWWQFYEKVNSTDVDLYDSRFNLENGMGECVRAGEGQDIEFS